MKAVLSFRLTVDHEDKNTPVFTFVKLYKEDDGLVWRLNGEFGDVCEALPPSPKSIDQAKADARAVYPSHSPFKPVASWL